MLPIQARGKLSQNMTFVFGSRIHHRASFTPTEHYWPCASLSNVFSLGTPVIYGSPEPIVDSSIVWVGVMQWNLCSDPIVHVKLHIHQPRI